MIRCGWCGAANYAIDSWCASCSRHLDWAPAAPAPRRRRRILLSPAVAAVAVAIVLALPVAARFATAGRPWTAALPNTAAGPATPAATASTSAATEPAPTPTPDATPTPPGATPAPQPGPAAEALPAQGSARALQPAAGDPATAIARFYQDVSGHDFSAAAALWSSRMQARYPPTVYIDHRFAATREIHLEAARIVGNGGGEAVVYVRVVEVLDGQTHYWVGTWRLVNTDAGWLLDGPNLRSDT